MIRITITGELTGKVGLIYELPRQKGRRKFVPAYKALVECSLTGKRFTFSVTRCSSAHCFDGAPEDRYGEKGECPPCGDRLYEGRIREDGPKGFRIELSESGREDSHTLVGQGTVVRKHVQIHFGAAASYGCLLVVGRRRLYPTTFERPLRAMLAQGDGTIEVMVHPR